MSKPIEDAADIISEQKALIEELQAKLAAQAAPVVAASEAPPADGWLIDGTLVYRLDETGTMNAYEVNVTMAQGSRKHDGPRVALAEHIRAMLAAAPAASVAVPAEKPLAPEGWDDAIRLMVKGYNYGAGYYNVEDFCNGLERLFILAGVYLDEDANEYRMPPATPAAQAQQPAGDGWMPIATAPRDGTAILLSNGTAVCQGYYIYEEPSIKDVRDLDGRHIDQIESDGFDGWMDFDGGMLPDPTHWQPMPLPPAPGLMEAE